MGDLIIAIKETGKKRQQKNKEASLGPVRRWTQYIVYKGIMKKCCDTGGGGGAGKEGGKGLKM